MKIDLTMNSAGFAAGFEQAARGRNKATFGKRVWSVLRRAKDWLVADSRPTRDEEVFLSKAQNHADLERRMLIIQNPECHQFHWRS